MQIPGYRILRKINQGGMSSVYLAVQLSVGREVALKVMSPVLNADPVFSQRFQREANIVGQLSHPHIVSIYDIGCYKNLNYIAMDYLPGGTVHERMRRGMSSTEILRVIREIAQALDLAHNKGYVHRDIKPENILFREDGAAVLTDFGVAKTVSAASRVTKSGTVVGTPHYMSPEQSRGMPMDGRSDLYSLGVVFYEMLTGVVPYQADEALAIAIKHLTAPIPSLPGHYAICQPLLNQLLAKNPKDRIQSGAQIAAAVEAIEEALNGYPKRTSSDPTQMETSALLKALLLTVAASLRAKLSLCLERLASLRWSRERGWYRKAEAVSMDLGARFTQQPTIVSTRINHALHYAQRRKPRILLRTSALLFSAALIWSTLSVAVLRFQLPAERYLPTALHRALHATAEGLTGSAEQADPPLAEAQLAAEAPNTEAGSDMQGTDTAGEVVPRVDEPLEQTVARHTLQVEPQPADARVRILNIREKYRPGIELAPGAYHVEVAKPDFVTHRQWLQLKSSERLAVTLKPRYRPGDSVFDELASGGKAPELVVIASGSFNMGKQGVTEASPVREVKIARQFAVGKYEVSFADYEKFAIATGRAIPNDNRWGRDSRPVVNVSWEDAVAYSKWLSEQTGHRYRLPTEAEWEYVARAGTASDFWWGNDKPASRANCKGGCKSDYTGLFSYQSAPVGSFAANPFGLHDTAGNASEWVMDCFQGDYLSAPTDGSAVELADCASRSVRGGSASDSHTSLSSFARRGLAADQAEPLVGLRLVRELNY